jgi:hypothetical protein
MIQITVMNMNGQKVYETKGIAGRKLFLENLSIPEPTSHELSRAIVLK